MEIIAILFVGILPLVTLALYVLNWFASEVSGEAQKRREQFDNVHKGIKKVSDGLGELSVTLREEDRRREEYLQSIKEKNNENRRLEEYLQNIKAKNNTD